MSLSCEGTYYDPDWLYLVAKDFSPAPLNIACCSCKAEITVGDDSLRIRRWDWEPNDSRCNLEDWRMCETCGGLYMSIGEAGLCCCDISKNLADQIVEYRRLK